MKRKPAKRSNKKLFVISLIAIAIKFKQEEMCERKRNQKQKKEKYFVSNLIFYLSIFKIARPSEK